MRIERLRLEFNINVKWIAFPLHPEIPEKGQTLEQLFAGRNIDIPAFSAQMKKLAKELDLPWCHSNMVYNTRSASELAKWAEEMDKGDLFHDAVFRAFFVRGMNIADVSFLKELCRELGLDPDEAEQILKKGIYKKAVDDDWRYSHRLGIRAVPTFLVAGLTVAGAQPYEILERLIHTAKGKSTSEKKGIK